MGASHSMAQAAAESAEGGGCPVMAKDAPAAGGCPMRGSPGGPAAQNSSTTFVSAASKAGASTAAAAAAAGDKGKVYNVRGEEINPSNRMPFNPNQERHPDQAADLSTQRVKSSIPKGGTDGETWTYPSPQMFYNALKRKGKGSDADETEMATVIAVHNNMNERTWSSLVEWERRNHPESAPRLRRFIGRPDELTPKARLLSMLGLRPSPFDRHDWTIDRNGEEVRYVLDYYYDEETGALDETPALHDTEAVRSISFDVRPALDSPTALVDRLRQLFDSELNSGAAAPPRESAPAPVSADPAAPNGVVGNLGWEEANARVEANCKGCRASLESCDSEKSCNVASVALQLCMAKVLCPPEAQRFSADGNEETYDAMASCMDNYRSGVMQYLAKQQAAAAAAEKPA